MKVHATDAANFSSLTASNGQFYFTLVGAYLRAHSHRRSHLPAKNGEVIGTSEMYTTTTKRDAGIASVMRWAPTAAIVIDGR